MKKLIQGIIDFRKGLTQEKRDLFAQLAIRQKPDVLFIGCSDSRVVPNLFASTDPGDLFVIRNVGNLIPPVSDSEQDNSVFAAIEFSIMSLQVSDIVICGHSECGAMQALAQGIDHCPCPHVRFWLKHAADSLGKFREGLTLDPSLSEYNQISQVNVLQQIEHLKTHPIIRECLEKNKLRIHGWWFDIGRSDVYCYEQSVHQFVLMDEEESKLILQRLT